MTRKVEPVSGSQDEVLNDFVSASPDCCQGAWLLLEELETSDPVLEDRCGLLNNQYEIYAMPVPGCRSLSLVVSLDIKGAAPWPCALHGLLSSRARVCDAGRQRAAAQFKLFQPSWEPSNE